MSQKLKKRCKKSNYFKHFLIFASYVIGCVLDSVFASVFGTPLGITSSEVGLKMCALTAVIKKHKSIIKKKRKKHDKIVLLAKTKLNTFKVLISKDLIDSYSHKEFVALNNVLR